MSAHSHLIGRYKKQIADDNQTIKAVISDGVRYLEGSGNSPMVDITDKRVAKAIERIELMKELIRIAEADN